MAETDKDKTVWQGHQRQLDSIDHGGRNARTEIIGKKLIRPIFEILVESVLNIK